MDRSLLSEACPCLAEVNGVEDGLHRTVYIELDSAWENGYNESFNGKLRDELLAKKQFDTLGSRRKCWLKADTNTTIRSFRTTCLGKSRRHLKPSWRGQATRLTVLKGFNHVALLESRK